MYTMYTLLLCVIYYLLYTYICIYYYVILLYISFYVIYTGDFPCSSVGKEPTCNAGDMVSIPGSGRCAGEGNGKPLQYSCLENPMDRGVWLAAVHGVTRVRHNLATKPPPLCIQ